MILQVMSRGKAEKFRSDVPWACISITTPASRPAAIDAENRLGLLRLEFADVEFSSRAGGITPDQAGKIWEFVETHLDRAGVLVVHCDAGMSRSPAVAAAITRIYGEDDSDWFRRYTPNRLVYRTLLEHGRREGQPDRGPDPIAPGRTEVRDEPGSPGQRDRQE